MSTKKSSGSGISIRHFEDDRLAFNHDVTIKKANLTVSRLNSSNRDTGRMKDGLKSSKYTKDSRYQSGFSSTNIYRNYATLTGSGNRDLSSEREDSSDKTAEFYSRSGHANYSASSTVHTNSESPHIQQQNFEEIFFGLAETKGSINVYEVELLRDSCIQLREKLLLITEQNEFLRNSLKALEIEKSDCEIALAISKCANKDLTIRVNTLTKELELMNKNLIRSKDLLAKAVNDNANYIDGINEATKQSMQINDADGINNEIIFHYTQPVNPDTAMELNEAHEMIKTHETTISELEFELQEVLADSVKNREELYDDLNKIIDQLENRFTEDNISLERSNVISYIVDCRTALSSKIAELECSKVSNM
jgi:hypothetical protein